MIRRPVWLFAVSALALVALALPAFSATPEDEQKTSKARIVRLSFVEGDVQISRPEEEDWERALVNMPVQQGYAIATGRGRAEIEFESGATVRLADNTQVQFNELALSSGDRITRMTLSQGSAIFYANLGRNDEFTVLTPGVQVSIPRNSRFRMDVTERHVNVIVSKGDVTVETQAGNYKVTKGKALLFDTRGAENAIVARASDTDEFDRWAADRDDALNSSRASSLQYVSAPFRYGVSDLAHYGTWIYAAPYGYVWMPLNATTAWTPYYEGRWIYTRGYGWTWVSYEPWGWLPYHYGSWAHVRGRWAWIPGGLFHSSWHPGLVVWLNLGGGRHGWCPRNPFDRPGRIHHNVNIRNTVIVNTGRGIVGGGRHDRIDRFDRITNASFGGDSARSRDHFGDVRELRGGFGGRNLTTGTGGRADDERGRPTGRTDERFVKGGDGLPARPNGVSAGAVGDANPAMGVSRGFAGRPEGGRRFDDENGRPVGRTEERKGKGRAEVVEQNGQPRGFSGRADGPARNPDNNSNDDNVDRRRSRFGNDPNSSVQFDSDRRRFENRPRPVGVERSREESSGERPSRFGGRGDSDPPPQRPQTRPEDSGRGWSGSRPSPAPSPSRTNDEQRSRAPESRPETRPEPRREPRPESRPESRPAPSSSGGWGGGRPSEPSRPSSPPPSSGGGGWGGGGSRPSSPAPAPAPRPSVGERPRRPN